MCRNWIRNRIHWPVRKLGRCLCQGCLGWSDAPACARRSGAAGQHLGSSSGAGHRVASLSSVPMCSLAPLLPFPSASPASAPCLPSARPADSLRHHLSPVGRLWGHEGLPAPGWMEAGVGRFICYRKTWLNGLTGEEGGLSRGFEAQEQWGAVPAASKPRCCLFFSHSCRQPAAAESLVTAAPSPSGRGLQSLAPPGKRAALAAF